MSGTRKRDGQEMTNKQQRDDDERKKILWIINDLRARDVHNSAEVVAIQHYEFITLAK
ncbi:hypothetical protein [Bacillus thuringiensis]|uniref:hypothetical protein n=1 Tax=Bacillus thuringiensis TaxID=1428 RepID=UPI001481FD31|nr:hypothetical protein [Bacillus thuringiensis]